MLGANPPFQDIDEEEGKYEASLTYSKPRESWTTGQPAGSTKRNE